jgi:NADPH-dependent curcumin reductase CurA
MNEENMINRQWIFTRIPTGALTPDIFEWRETSVPEPKAGEVLVQTRLLSLDPANRAWMHGRTYREAVVPGDVMHGFTVGEVASSTVPEFSPGDIVEGMGGWQDYSVVAPSAISKRHSNDDLLHLVGVLSITGLTAYFGLLEVGRPMPGDTLLVSAAAGAVGAIVGQIGKIVGCRVVGIAGGPEKCRWLTENIGFDAAVDYKTPDFKSTLRSVCSDGVDIYFDNVGGQILERALALMNQHGRVVCCGAVSQYDLAEDPPRKTGIPGVLVARRLRMEGFIVLDFLASRTIAEARIRRWIRSGELVAPIDLVDGLEQSTHGAHPVTCRWQSRKDGGEGLLKIDERPIP